MQTISTEVETLMTLNHPNVVKLEDVYEDANHVWIVMEFVSGGELASILRKTFSSFALFHANAIRHPHYSSHQNGMGRGGRRRLMMTPDHNTAYSKMRNERPKKSALLREQLPVSEHHVRLLVIDLISAVHYLHSRGIVHRDLKTANCLICDREGVIPPDHYLYTLVHHDNKEVNNTNGQQNQQLSNSSRQGGTGNNKSGRLNLKITDFGFATLAGTRGSQCLSAYCGTMVYMAPEIVLQQNYGTPVDMWACGVMIYFLFSGEYPFKAVPATPHSSSSPLPHHPPPHPSHHYTSNYTQQQQHDALLGGGDDQELQQQQPRRPMSLEESICSAHVSFTSSFRHKPRRRPRPPPSQQQQNQHHHHRPMSSVPSSSSKQGAEDGNDDAEEDPEGGDDYYYYSDDDDADRDNGDGPMAYHHGYGHGDIPSGAGVAYSDASPTTVPHHHHHHQLPLPAPPTPTYDPIWSKVSRGAKDFIKKLLHPDPSERLTAAAAMQHSWIQAGLMNFGSLREGLHNYSSSSHHSSNQHGSSPTSPSITGMGTTFNTTPSNMQNSSSNPKLGSDYDYKRASHRHNSAGASDAHTSPNAGVSASPRSGSSSVARTRRGGGGMSGRGGMRSGVLLSMFRALVAAVLAAHRLVHLGRMVSLRRQHLDHYPLLRNFPYSVSGRYEPSSTTGSSTSSGATISDDHHHHHHHDGPNNGGAGGLLASAMNSPRAHQHQTPTPASGGATAAASSTAPSPTSSSSPSQSVVPSSSSAPSSLLGTGGSGGAAVVLNGRGFAPGNMRAVTALIACLDACPRCQVFDISGNGIESIDVLLALEKVVRRPHPSLHTIVLDHNPLPPLAGRTLQRIARSASTVILASNHSHNSHSNGHPHTIASGAFSATDHHHQQQQQIVMSRLRRISLYNVPTIGPEQVAQINTILKEAEKKRQDNFAALAASMASVATATTLEQHHTPTGNNSSNNHSTHDDAAHHPFHGNNNNTTISQHSQTSMYTNANRNANHHHHHPHHLPPLHSNGNTPVLANQHQRSSTTTSNMTMDHHNFHDDDPYSFTNPNTPQHLHNNTTSTRPVPLASTPSMSMMSRTKQPSFTRNHTATPNPTQESPGGSATTSSTHRGYRDGDGSTNTMAGGTRSAGFGGGGGPLGRPKLVPPSSGVVPQRGGNNGKNTISATTTTYVNNNYNSSNSFVNTNTNHNNNNNVAVSITTSSGASVQALLVRPTTTAQPGRNGSYTSTSNSHTNHYHHDQRGRGGSAGLQMSLRRKPPYGSTTSGSSSRSRGEGPQR